MAVILLSLLAGAHAPASPPPAPSRATACIGTTRDAEGHTVAIDSLDALGHVVRRVVSAHDGWRTVFTRHYLRMHHSDAESLVFWTEDTDADGTVDDSAVVRIQGSRVVQQRRTGGGAIPSGNFDQSFLYEGDANWPQQRAERQITFSVDISVDPNTVETWSPLVDDAFVRRTRTPVGGWVEEDWRLSGGRVAQAGDIAFTWTNDEIATRTQGGEVTTYERAQPTARCRLAEAVLPWSRYGPGLSRR